MCGLESAGFCWCQEESFGRTSQGDVFNFVNNGLAEELGWFRERELLIISKAENAIRVCDNLSPETDDIDDPFPSQDIGGSGSCVVGVSVKLPL